MKVLVAQINLKIGDLSGNTARIIETLDDARAQKADIVLFSELTICGYPPEDLVFHEAFLDSMLQHLRQIIKASKDLMVLVGLVRPSICKGEKHLLNSAAVICDGKLLGFQDKWLLPTYDVFNERRYFDTGTTTRVWNWKGKRIGVIICEDIWQHGGYIVEAHYPRDPVLELVQYKPDVLLNLTASPYQFQKPDIRVQVCGKAAKTLECPVVLCCQVGANDQIIFDGYSLCVDKEGNLRQLAKGFEEDFMLVDLEAPACHCPLNYDPMYDLYRALVLGVKDYFHKQGFTKACFGLSGGIDSALVAAIATDALGSENILGINMPSQYTSKEGNTDAKKLAENLNISFKEIPIKELFDQFRTELKPVFKDQPEDVTEENLQARIRGMILMAISNKFGHLVLSTGNKSEVALGYCTLYGDMAGGLAVIGDVPKTLVYDLARWVNREKEIIPKGIIERPPSAELSPGQKDLDSLPDYDIVDKVLKGYVEDYLSLDEISSKYELPLELVMDLVARIHRAEYKRRQGPPIIRVSKKSFGVGRQYPIVQGWM